MKRVLETGWLPLLLAAILVASLPAPTEAGIGDKLKKKTEDKAKKEADKAINQTGEDATNKDGEASESSGEKAEAAPKGSGDVAGVSTKFDYVPGDMVLFFDDFTQDELGEFPINWKLNEGTLEVAEMNGQRWLRSTSVTSRFAMKAPAATALPEFWTLELDFYCGEASGNVLNVYGKKGNTQSWALTLPYSTTAAYFESGKVTANTPLEGTPQVWGVTHHIMFMARGNAIKVYVNQQRVANIPEIDLTGGAPDHIEFSLWSDKEPMITNVRFAEGNKPVADPFANGKLVTYGIYFDSGSDVVKPESAPVLRQIAAYMEKNAAVKVNILGHTDNQGTPDGNLDLSKRRSASVAKVLSSQFKIAADRFTTDGMGDTKPVADNAKSEGRAANRRVEFTKL
jgi:outer membrane protein OmpA-like peptidoglycan-associated protein